jgi:hypothetical protein
MHIESKVVNGAKLALAKSFASSLGNAPLKNVLLESCLFITTKGGRDYSVFSNKDQSQVSIMLYCSPFNDLGASTKVT